MPEGTHEEHLLCNCQISHTWSLHALGRRTKRCPGSGGRSSALLEKKGWHECESRTQVYRGRLRSTGEEVAVKVQRPGIGENIAIDMVLLRRLMAAFDAALPRLRLPIQACLTPVHRHRPSLPFACFPSLPAI